MFDLGAIRWQHIRFESRHPFLYSDLGAGTVLSSGGWYEAVLAEGRVFDALTGPNGMALREYVAQLQLPVGRSLRYRAWEDGSPGGDQLESLTQHLRDGSVLVYMLKLESDGGVRRLGLKDMREVHLYINAYESVVFERSLMSDYQAFFWSLVARDQQLMAGLGAYTGGPPADIDTIYGRLCAEVRRYLGEHQGMPAAEGFRPGPPDRTTVQYLLDLEPRRLAMHVGTMRIDYLDLFLDGRHAARRDLDLPDDYGDFLGWLATQHPATRDLGLVALLPEAGDEVVAAVDLLVTRAREYVALR